MKRACFTLLLIAVLILALIGCTSTLVYNESGAIDRFLSWLTDNGYPNPPETPMVGLLLGEVKKGDVIGSNSPLMESPQRASEPLAQNGWLFYIDECPGAFYEHPGRIVVVSTSGAILVNEPTNGWPTVNGNRPIQLNSATSDRYFGAIVWNPYAWCKPDTHNKTWFPSAISASAKGAVVVNGCLTEETLSAEAKAISKQFLNDMKTLFGNNNVRDLTSPTVMANPAEQILQAVEYLVVNRDCRNIVLYIIGHGGNDRISIGGTSYRASQLHTLINSYPDVLFSVILETCHAGSWLDNFDGTTSRILENLGLFIASTSADKFAYPDWDQLTLIGIFGDGLPVSVLHDHNKEDSYVEWTSDFLQQLSFWSTGAGWTAVQNYANTHGIETEWSLFYHCFWKVKGAGTVPPPDIFPLGENTLTMTERMYISRQDPQIYKKW